MTRKPRKDIGVLRWTESCRAVLMQLWIADTEHLVSRIASDLELTEELIKYSLRRLKAHEYVAQRPGVAGPLPQSGDRSHRVYTHGSLSSADLWCITQKGKDKASALAEEKEKRQ